MWIIYKYRLINWLGLKGLILILVYIKFFVLSFALFSLPKNIFCVDNIQIQTDKLARTERVYTNFGIH